MGFEKKIVENVDIPRLGVALGSLRFNVQRSMFKGKMRVVQPAA